MDGSQLPQAIPPLADEAAAAFREGFLRLKHEVGKVIVGQDEVVDSVIIALAADGHVLLEGVPGLGKTLLVRSLSQALRLEFNRVQFTPDLMPADIIGTHMLLESEGRRHMTFSKGPIFTSVLLADEINRATPKTQSALLEAMAERHVTTGGVGHELPKPFFVLATQNPLEMEGTYPLPEAQLDRFLVKVLVPFPTLQELSTIIDRTTGTLAPTIEPVMEGAELLAMQRTVRQVLVADPVKRYALRLVLATHRDSPLAAEAAKSYIRYGASPRGAQAIILCARVRALLDGRAQVAFRDVRDAVLATMRHRIILNFEAEGEGVTPDDVLERVLEEVPETTSSVASEAG
jgi:MoxR-like ATPase